MNRVKKVKSNVIFCTGEQAGRGAEACWMSAGPRGAGQELVVFSTHYGCVLSRCTEHRTAARDDAVYQPLL